MQWAPHVDSGHVVHEEVSVVVEVDNELLELADEFGLLGARLNVQIQRATSCECEDGIRES